MPRPTIDPDTLPTDAPDTHFGAGYILERTVQDTALSMLNEHAEALDTLEAAGLPDIEDIPGDTVTIGGSAEVVLQGGTTIVDGMNVTDGENVVFEVNTATQAVGFYGHLPVAQQTGVAVTAEAIHAALVALGLITA